MAKKTTANQTFRQHFLKQIGWMFDASSVVDPCVYKISLEVESEVAYPFSIMFIYHLYISTFVYCTLCVSTQVIYTYVTYWFACTYTVYTYYSAFTYSIYIYIFVRYNVYTIYICMYHLSILFVQIMKIPEWIFPKLWYSHVAEQIDLIECHPVIYIPSQAVSFWRGSNCNPSKENDDMLKSGASLKLQEPLGLNAVLGSWWTSNAARYFICDYYTPRKQHR